MLQSEKNDSQTKRQPGEFAERYFFKILVDNPANQKRAPEQLLKYRNDNRRADEPKSDEKYDE